MVGDKNIGRNPENAIVRHQMMELFTKIAEEKYIKQFATKTFNEAVAFLFEDHLKQDINGFDSQIWRSSRLWNEKCD